MSNTQTVSHFPKYRIAELLRNSYGELNIKQGVEDLQKHCKSKNIRTVQDWLKIPAGNATSINHLIIGSVLEFFQMQTESQLFTQQHKDLLKKKTVAT